MTFFAQGNIIRNISEVFLAYIRPFKISLLSFWNLVHSTVFAVFRNSKPSLHPLVLRPVRSSVRVPEVILFASITKSVTFHRAILFCTRICSNVIISTRDTLERMFILGMDHATFLRTQKNLFRFSFNPAFISIKGFFTNWANSYNHNLILT